MGLSSPIWLQELVSCYTGEREGGRISVQSTEKYGNERLTLSLLCSSCCCAAFSAPALFNSSFACSSLSCALDNVRKCDSKSLRHQVMWPWVMWPRVMWSLESCDFGTCTYCNRRTHDLGLYTTTFSRQHKKGKFAGLHTAIHQSLIHEGSWFLTLEWSTLQSSIGLPGAPGVPRGTRCHPCHRPDNSRRKVQCNKWHANSAIPRAN